MKRTSVIAAVLLACLVAVPVANAAGLGVKASFWYPMPSGELRVDDTVAIGSGLDFEDDLNLGQEGVPEVTAFLAAGRHHLGATYTRLNFSSSGVLKTDKIYAGYLIPKGTPVETELDWPMLDLEYGYDIIKFDAILAGLSLTGIGRIKFMDASTSLTMYGQTVESGFKPAVPMIGGAAHLDILLGMVAADVKVAGMAYSSNTVLDASAEVVVTPLPFVGVSLGYRYLILDLEYDETYTDATFDGFYGLFRIAF
ncbi:MAG: hypothetical protein HZB23_02730 [Deltaproteobacteria bacterium]|nr:hypothetical protein [Deltaproteobacteria bacterium]